MKTSRDTDRSDAHRAIKLPPVVSPQEWQFAHQKMLERRRPSPELVTRWLPSAGGCRGSAWGRRYGFEVRRCAATFAPICLRRAASLIVYHALSSRPGAFTAGPSTPAVADDLAAGADQVSNLAHLNARDTTLAFVSRAPGNPTSFARNPEMGWDMPWYTLTDSFDVDFDVDRWHGTNVFFATAIGCFAPTSSIPAATRRWGPLGATWTRLLLDARRLGRTHPRATRRLPPYHWWRWHDEYAANAAPDQRWIEVAEAGQVWKDPEQS